MADTVTHDNDILPGSAEDMTGIMQIDSFPVGGTATDGGKRLKLLLIGRPGSLMRAFIDKAHKQRQTVFMLSDMHDRSPKPRHVFERYRFNYTAESIREVLDSVRPDRIVFFGPFDPSFTFTGTKANNNAFEYISGLMNILLCCNTVDMKQFIYLTDSSVFEDNYPAPIMPDTPMTPHSVRSLVLAQAEDIVRRHGATTQLETCIVRIDNLYGIPYDRTDSRSFMSRLCLDMCIKKKISFNARHEFSGIYMNDAVEGLYAIIAASKRESSTYHLGSQQITNEGETASLLTQVSRRAPETDDRTVGETHRVVLDCSDTDREFGLTIRHSYADGAENVFRYISNHLDDYLTDEERKARSRFAKLSKRAQRLMHLLWGTLENIAVFVVVFLLNQFSVNSTYFEGVDFFLIYVLIFAMIYGRQQAVFSAFLSVAGYLAVQMGVRGGFAVLVDFNTYIWMAQLFIVGLTVGHLRERLTLLREDKDEEINYLNLQLEEIEEINDSNKRIKQIIESRLVNYTESLGILYDMVTKIEASDPGQVLFHTAREVSRLMQTGHVSVYRINGRFARLFAATSDTAKSLGKSIRYGEYGLMSEAFAEHKVFINRDFDTVLPSMAIAVYDEDLNTSTYGNRRYNINLIIMVWDLPIERMTLAQANMLTVMGRIIARSTYHANIYLDTLSDGQYLPDTHILNEKAFAETVAMHTNAARDELTEFCLLEIKRTGRTLAEASEIILPLIRDTDCIGVRGEQGSERLFVMLTNTGGAESAVVLSRLSEHGITAEVVPVKEPGDE